MRVKRTLDVRRETWRVSGLRLVLRAGGDVIMRGVRNELPGLEIAIAGSVQRSTSTIATVGGYVVVVATAVPRLAVTLTSVYLGQIDGDTAATHLLLAPGRRAELRHRVVPAAPASATTGRQPDTAHARSCVLDHAAELQRLLAELADDVVAIDVGPAALEHAAGAWLADLEGTG